VSAIRTFFVITSVAGVLAATPAYADTPVDPGTPVAQEEGAPLPGGDPVNPDEKWTDVSKAPEDEGAPLPGGDPEPKDPNWVDDTKIPEDEGAPRPGGDPEPADSNWLDDTKIPEDEGAPLPGGDPEPDQIKMVAAVVLASAR
jgi:hypothetical protein